MDGGRRIPRHGGRALPVILIGLLLLAMLIFMAAAPEAEGGGAKRCEVPSLFAGNFFELRARSTSCREARRVLRNRRCSGRCRVFFSRGRAGRYRCPTKPNDMEGADFRCSGPGRRLVTFSSGS